MSGVNPVVLIQMLMRYDQMRFEENEANPRTFAFTKNNRMRVHKETGEEVLRRRSWVGPATIELAEKKLTDLLLKSLQGRVNKKIYVSPAMARIAVPLETSTGSTGFGVMTTGSRIPIPEGKFIRAFTYWEKVNDIDLSCFGIDDEGHQTEFSWRTMWGLQSEIMTFSGDQTSGYNGGSEFFDIRFDEFRKEYPNIEYLVFCDNVYSQSAFSKCTCKAGFMVRDDPSWPLWKGTTGYNPDRNYGELFDPKTVATSFRIDSDSTFAYMFAIDLVHREMIWLNISRAGEHHVAGTSDMRWLTKYFRTTNVFNAHALWTNVGISVEDPSKAEVIVGDLPNEKVFRDRGAEIIHSWDFEKMLAVLGTPSA